MENPFALLTAVASMPIAVLDESVYILQKIYFELCVCVCICVVTCACEKRAWDHLELESQLVSVPTAAKLASFVRAVCALNL